MSRPTISLQLYTLRDAMSQNEAATLEKVAALGYEGVEGGFPASPAFIAKCRELNLKITGCHATIEALESDFEGVVAQNKETNTQFIIIPYVGEEWRGSLEKWTQLGQKLNAIGQKLRDEGLMLCYHNHDFEFESFDGKTGLDAIYEAADSGCLQAELDTYWVQKGGASPVEYLRKYAGRTPVLHIKDMSSDGKFAEIGNGTLDWPAIFSAAEAGGVTVYAVEQDTCPGNPFDSIALSIENLRKMGKI